MSIDRELIDMLRTEMRTGFASVAVRIDQTNARLGETNATLFEAITDLRTFRSETKDHLNGITKLLLANSKAEGKLEERVSCLEQRVDKLEDSA